MDKYVVTEYGFGCFYLILLVALSFGVGAGIMWIFHDYLGVSAVIVAGVMGVGHGLNAVARMFDKTSHTRRV